MKPREAMFAVLTLKRLLIRASALTVTMASMSAEAQTVVHPNIENPGFENGFYAWREVDPSGEGISISGVERSGTSSAKATIQSRHRIAQTVTVQPNTRYKIRVYIL